MNNTSRIPFFREHMWERVVFLLLTSIVVSFFFPVSILATVPLALLFLSYEKRVVVIGISLAFVIFFLLSSGPTALLYAVFILFAFLASEIIKRDVSPVWGVYIIGGLGVALAILLWGGLWLSGHSLESEIHKAVVTSIEVIKKERGELISQSTSEQGLILKEALDKPEIITKEIVAWTPAITVVSIFFTAWLTLILVLRNSLYWKERISYSYKLKDLIRFKAPDYFVYPLIISLALALSSEAIGLGKLGETIAFNVLYILGVFYFFHGFGIYSDFLDHMKVYGIMRSLLTLMTVLMAARMLVFIGVFDLWINFRKFFKQKKDKQGDIS